MKAKELITAYYSAFNRRDAEALLSLLSESIIHEINQGKTETGKHAFRDHLGFMDSHYAETAQNLVVMVSADEKRAAAEFLSVGRYLRAEHGMPPARGQPYRLRMAAVFDIADGKISRVSTHYNVQDWISQVSRTEQKNLDRLAGTGPSSASDNPGARQ